MDQQKYEKLLEDLTAELKKINEVLPVAICEINHLRKAIDKAEKSVNPDYIGNHKIEKRS